MPIAHPPGPNNPWQQFARAHSKPRSDSHAHRGDCKHIHGIYFDLVATIAFMCTDCESVDL